MKDRNIPFISGFNTELSHKDFKVYKIEPFKATLFFGNPHAPYSWEVVSEDNTGYSCLFSEYFFKPWVQALAC